MSVGVVAAVGVAAYGAYQSKKAADEQRDQAKKLDRQTQAQVKKQLGLADEIKQQYDQNYRPLQEDYAQAVQAQGNEHLATTAASRAASGATSALALPTDGGFDPSQASAQAAMMSNTNQATTTAGAAAADAYMNQRQNYLDNLAAATQLGQGVSGAATNAASATMNSALSSAESSAKIQNELSANVGATYGEISRTAADFAGKRLGSAFASTPPN